MRFLLIFKVVSCLIIFRSIQCCAQVTTLRTEITIGDNGGKTTEEKRRILVTRKEHNWLGEFRVLHRPTDKFILKYAYILDKNGNQVRKLKNKDITTSSAHSDISFFTDDLITSFNLIWSDYPYTIEYAYTLYEKEYLSISWTPVLFERASTVDATLIVKAPVDFKLNIDHPDDAPPSSTISEDSKIYAWSNLSYEVIRKEVLCGPFHRHVPVINIFPLNFTYSIEGEQGSWESFGYWQEKLNRGCDVLPMDNKIEISPYLRSAKSDKQIINRVYHYLQDNTKYISVSIEDGGLKSYPATYVSENKYGDCKALTSFMKGILNNQGFRSYYTLVNAGVPIERINPSIPGQQFNHVISMIPLENDTIWLENTSPYFPFNYLGTFTQNRMALAVRENSSRLIKTPALSVDQCKNTHDYNIVIRKDSSFLNVNMTFRGEKFETLRYLIHLSDDEKIEQEIKEYIPLSNFEVENWAFLNFHRDSTFVECEVKGKMTKLLESVGPFQVLRAFDIGLPPFESPEHRNLPVQIDIPIHNSISRRFELKDMDYSEIEMPESIHIESEFGKYNTQFTFNNNIISTFQNLIIYSGEYDISIYPKFYEFIDQIKSYQRTIPILIK